MEGLFPHSEFYIISIFIFMLLSAFFSSTETSLVSCNRIRLETLNKKGNKNAGRALYILDNIEYAIGMLLIGNNIVNISAASFITYIATKSFLVNDIELMIVTAVQTIIFLIFCEVSPKIIARAIAGNYIMFFSYPIIILMILSKPIVKISLIASYFIKKIFKIENQKNSLLMSRDEIDILFRIGGKEGIIDKENQLYVSEILSFKDLTAREVMTPTIDIISIEIGQNIKNLIDVVVRTKFSRIPVYKDRVDNIIGYIFYRDIVKNKNVKKISDLINKAHYVPTTKKIFELYSEMQENILPIIFVVNEYGAVVGMVTHEDIVEEIVGEIQTRDQSNEDLITKIHTNRYILNADLDIDYFMRKFPIKIQKKGFKTVAGFIAYEMGKIPKKGDKFVYDKYTFIVDEATDRSIEKVILATSKK